MGAREDKVTEYSEEIVEAYERIYGEDDYDNLDLSYRGQFVDDGAFANDEWPSSGPPAAFLENGSEGWICRELITGEGYFESNGYYFGPSS